MVNIEQNQIIKIFSIAAVIFLPPTLIASIYGMNFNNMPELSWKYGYLATLILMVASAVAPYHFFLNLKNGCNLEFIAYTPRFMKTIIRKTHDHAPAISRRRRSGSRPIGRSGDCGSGDITLTT